MNFNFRSSNRMNNSFSKAFYLQQRLQKNYPLKRKYNSIIPLKIFQTWHTKHLPPNMNRAVEIVKRVNPAFQHYLFDDNDCREYIKNNFPGVVVEAFDGLIPGAYKADLWRYCVLYKEGGIYVDIKYIPNNGFRFINLTEREHFVLDADQAGVYNALMVCKPGNEILFKAINSIVRNVKTKYYGHSILDPTGPKLLAKFFSYFQKKLFALKHETYNADKYIDFNDIIILKMYPNYYKEMGDNEKTEHYSVLWDKRRVYK